MAKKNKDVIIGNDARETLAVGISKTVEAVGMVANTGLQMAFTTMSALAFMVFSQLYTPCMTALGTIKKEAGGWKWMFLSAIGNFVVAWVVSLLVYQVGTLLGF